MATSDMKLAARPSVRITKPSLSGRTHHADFTKHDLPYGLYTRGSKISSDASQRQKVSRAPPTAADSICSSNQGVKGLTLEDYIRGRTNAFPASPIVQHPQTVKYSKVIRLKQEDAGMCFDQTFEIEEEDEDNYSQNRNEQLPEGFLPQIKRQRSRRNHHIKHVQTEASDEPFDYSPQLSRPSRLMTSYNEELFLPIHSLGREKQHLRRSFYRRQQRSKSNSQKEEQGQVKRVRSKEVHELASKCLNLKTNTMSDFYQPSATGANRLDKNIRVELGYVTKYANKFRLNPLLDGKQRPHRRIHN